LISTEFQWSADQQRPVCFTFFPFYDTVIPENKMAFISIFNDVMGPVMRGPSISHTAGSYHIGKMVRFILGEEPTAVEFTFDPEGSYARVFREQGVDLALVSGLLGFALTDDLFFQAIKLAEKKGWKINFKISKLKQPAIPILY
jgi:L-serine dehydratase